MSQELVEMVRTVIKEELASINERLDRIEKTVSSIPAIQQAVMETAETVERIEVTLE